MKALPTLLLTLAFAAPAFSAQDLTIGSDAPALTVEHWIQGDAAPANLDKGIFVVEFWATWCGPCKSSMPHLTQLAKVYKGKVQFMGVSDEDLKVVNEFLADGWSEKIGYTLGTDSDGSMQKTWMDAAGQDGIPSAFLLQDGKIAWIGHPMTMDDVLAEVVAGTYDLEAKKKEAARIQKLETLAAPIFAKIETIWAQLGAAGSEEDAMEILQGAIPLFLEVVALDPVHFGQVHMQTISVQIMVKAYAEAMAEAAKFVKANWENAEGLNGIAWMLVDPENTPLVSDFDLAVKAATQAVKLTQEKDPSILDTLARAYFVNGDKDSAVKWGELALKLADDAEMKAAFQDALDEYQGKDELDF